MFKDLKNKLSKIQAYSEYKLDTYTNKPFWIWSEEEHIHEYKLTNGKSCFQYFS